MGLNAKQVEQLLRGINPKRVLHTRGQAHLAGWDVEAHLTRIFGFEGWDKKVRSIELVFEDGARRNGSDRVGWFVTYRCLMTLVIKDPQGNVVREIDDGATGSAENQPQRGEAHDLAYKNAITYALKRCAKDLGDQFGLSLYNGGSTTAIIGRVLNVGEDGDVESATPDEVHPDTEPGAEEHGEESQEAPVPAAASNGHARHTEKPAANPGNGHQPPRPSRPQGPPATERGAQAVPTGKGDNGEWVNGFMQRLAAVKDPDDLGGVQGQIAAAARVKTITPGKATELSAAVRERRTELQGVSA